MNLKKIGYVLAVLLVGVGILALSPKSLTSNEQSLDDKNRWVLGILNGALQNFHYDPEEMNDEYSKKAFDKFLTYLDNGKVLFIQEDIDQLKVYETKVDDLVKLVSLDLFNVAYELYRKRTEEQEKYTEKFLSKPFNFSKEEVLETDSKKILYAKNKKELKNRWRKLLKYQVLSMATSAKRLQEEAHTKNDTVTLKSWKVLEQNARKKLLKTYKNRYHRNKQKGDKYALRAFYNSIVNTYDPHTVYFPPKDQENFNIQISGRLEGIGATLQPNEDGLISVVRIVPGSASWKQGDLKAGDLILKVAQGSEIPVDVTDMPLDEAVQLIRGKKGTEVRLTVHKKSSGEEVIIPIIRDVVEIEESYAKSVIIEDKENNKKIGFINLPQFYADFSRRGGRRCATDMRKELNKMNAEGVDGVIIDLRFNGGGSLQDVVEIGGLFVDKGPIVQSKSRGARTIPYNDDDKGETLYDGPLMIMVSEESASASEILAAAIQDYKRGIVVGVPTYGKGTVQTIAELDKMAPDEAKIYRPLGALKFTNATFYRIDGTTTQKVGVTPDIIIPTVGNYAANREGTYSNALPSTTVNRALGYQERNGYIENLEELKKASEKRVVNNETFQLIEEYANVLKNRQEDTEVVLTVEGMEKERAEMKKTNKKYEVINKEVIESLVLTPLPQDAVVANDTTQNASIQQWYKSIRKDVAVKEAINIMSGMKDKRQKQ
ncbi:MAG: tail-specific protease [Cytophagales bacterium]|nr:tail-specific protease [Cytophagales bacterium]